MLQMRKSFQNAIWRKHFYIKKLQTKSFQRFRLKEKTFQAQAEIEFLKAKVGDETFLRLSLNFSNKLENIRWVDERMLHDLNFYNDVMTVDVNCVKLACEI